MKDGHGGRMAGARAVRQPRPDTYPIRRKCLTALRAEWWSSVVPRLRGARDPATACPRSGSPAGRRRLQRFVGEPGDRPRTRTGLITYCRVVVSE